MMVTRRSSFVTALVGVALVATLVSASAASAGGGGNSLNAKACQKYGWRSLVTSTGVSFASEDACVSYAAKGGVLKKPQTVSFSSVNPLQVAIGASYTPTATATSGLPVAITLDATSTGCSLTSGSVTFTAAGTCVIDANQAGNATYNAAPQVQQSIIVMNDQQLCESFGGTFGGPATGLLWTCNGLPNATIDEWGGFRLSPGGLVYQCFFADTGRVFNYSYVGAFDNTACV